MVIRHLVITPKQNKKIFSRALTPPPTPQAVGLWWCKRRCQQSWRLWFYKFIPWYWASAHTCTSKCPCLSCFCVDVGAYLRLMTRCSRMWAESCRLGTTEMLRWAPHPDSLASRMFNQVEAPKPRCSFKSQNAHWREHDTAALEAGYTHKVITTGSLLLFFHDCIC